MPENENPDAVVVQTMIYENDTRFNYRFVASDFGMPVSSIQISKIAFRNIRPRSVTLAIYYGDQ